MTRALSLAVMLAACGGGDDGGEPPIFPESYATTYQEVRNCRNSNDHDLRRIRVLASADAVTAYQNRGVFPVGAVILKVEHEGDDTACAGAPIGFTVMQRLADGSDPTFLDWRWQETDGDRKILEVNVRGCANCHEACPDGHAGTCTLP